MTRATPVIAVVAAGREEPVASFLAGMRNHGFVEGQNVTCHVRVAHGDHTRLAGFAEELALLEPNLITVVGAVTARAVRAVSRTIPIVYAVVVEPCGDGLAAASGAPLPNLTGVTTFDPYQAQAQIKLLQTIQPDLKGIVYLTDAAVSDCLANAGRHAAADAGIVASVLRVDGSAPDLQSVFGDIRDNASQALVLLEQPALGVHAEEIAERAVVKGLLTLFPLTQAGAGGLLSYGTSLGQAATAMAGQASRILSGEAVVNLPIQTLSQRSLIADQSTARRLGITIPDSVLGRCDRVLQ